MSDKDQKEPGSRLLTLDVGNTNLTWGIFKGQKLEHQWRTQTNVVKTSDEYGIELEGILNHFNYKREHIKDAIIGSVVPVLNHRFNSMMTRFLKISPYIVGEGTKTGIPIKMDNPKDVGSDRIINAVAGFEKYGGPLVIIDIGTAITHDVVSSDGAYLGGSIAPGVSMGADGLTSRTAKLPKVELQLLDHAIGKNTIEAMQIGIVQGYLGMVDHLTEIIVREIKEKESVDRVRVVATGGYSSLLSKNSKYIEIVDRDLTLDGLRIIYEKTLKARRIS